MSNSVSKNNIPNKPIPFIWFNTKPYLIWAILGIICVLCASFLHTSVAYVFKRIIDLTTGVSGEVDFDMVFIWVLLYPFVEFVGHLFWRLSGNMGMRWITYAETHGYKKLFEYLLQEK